MKFDTRMTRLLMAIMLAVVILTPIKAGSDSPQSSTPAMPGSFAKTTGMCVIDLKTGVVIYEINGSKAFIPASVTKALTTASVLCLKDSSEMFVTPVVALGKINDGTLNGNVVVSCVGDPTIESRHFKDAQGFADSVTSGLQALGIRHITGRVVIDEAGSHNSGIPAGWMTEDLTEPYGAELQAANFADNCVSLSMPSRKTTPSTPALTVEHKKCKGHARLRRERSGKTITMTGTLPRKGMTTRVANPVAASTLKTAIERSMATVGISIENRDIKHSGGRAELVYTHLSPRFTDIMRSLMFRSDNLMAEGMLRTLAPGESRQEAIAEEMDIWKDNEIDMSDIMLEDGSGLSRNNRLTPRFLASVLDWMSRSLVAQSYVRLFPRAGVEGTVRNFLKNTPFEGKMILKSGSMRGVQSYAGYLLDEYGNPSHAVVVMSNDFKCSRGQLRTAIADVLMQIFYPQSDFDSENSPTDDDFIQD